MEALILGASTDGELLVPIVKVLVAAGFVAVVMLRFRVASVPAYLVAGALLGPDAIGFIEDADQLSEIGHLSIILLMFGIGLELDMHVFRHAFKQIIIAILLALTLTAAMLMPIMGLFGATGPAAIAVAMALTLSSTALVLRTLHSARELDTTRGRMCLSILVGQDIAVVPALIIIPILGAVVAASVPGGADAGLDISTEAIVRTTGVAVLGIGGIIVVGLFVIPRLLQYAAKHRAAEVLLVVAAAFAVGSSAVTNEMGLSAELGAFLSGFLLSTTPFKHQLSGQIVMFRDLLIAVFFTTLGMKLQLSVVTENIGIILFATFAMLVIKTVGITAGCFFASLPLGVSIATGVTLAQAGEFSIIILQLASSDGVGLIDAETNAKATSAVVLGLILTPALMALGKRVANSSRLNQTFSFSKKPIKPGPAESDTPPEGERHVIIAGFGIVGRAVADQIGEYCSSVTVIELNPGTVSRQRALGRQILYGDASNPEVLHAAGIGHAQALVLTIADDNAAIRAVETARIMRKDLTIIVRTGYMGKGLAAKSLGASEIIVEEVVTAQAMSDAVHRSLTGEPSAKA